MRVADEQDGAAVSTGTVGDPGPLTADHEGDIITVHRRLARSRADAPSLIASDRVRETARLIRVRLMHSIRSPMTLTRTRTTLVGVRVSEDDGERVRWS